MSRETVLQGGRGSWETDLEKVGEVDPVTSGEPKRRRKDSSNWYRQDRVVGSRSVSSIRCYDEQESSRCWDGELNDSYEEEISITVIEDWKFRD